MVYHSVVDEKETTEKPWACDDAPQMAQRGVAWILLEEVLKGVIRRPDGGWWNDRTWVTFGPRALRIAHEPRSEVAGGDVDLNIRLARMGGLSLETHMENAGSVCGPFLWRAIRAGSTWFLPSGNTGMRSRHRSWNADDSRLAQAAVKSQRWVWAWGLMLGEP